MRKPRPIDNLQKIKEGKIYLKEKWNLGKYIYQENTVNVFSGRPSWGGERLVFFIDKDGNYKYFTYKEFHILFTKPIAAKRPSPISPAIPLEKKELSIISKRILGGNGKSVLSMLIRDYKLPIEDANELSVELAKIQIKASRDIKSALIKYFGQSNLDKNNYFK